jgi:cyclohexadienyl dehydratase
VESSLLSESVVEPDRTIVVATSGDYSPFSLWPTGRPAPSGFSVDLAQAFAAAEASEVVWQRFAWPELVPDLIGPEATRFDVALSGVTIRPERSVAGLFSVPVTSSGVVVLVPSTGQGSPVDAVEQLDAPGIRLGVNAGGHLEKEARRLFARASILAIPNNAGVLGMLDRDEVDAVVTDSIEAPHWQAQRPGLRALGPLTEDHKAALFPPTRASLARRFDAWLLDAEAAGQLDLLRRRHGLPLERTAQPGLALLASLDERLSLMPAVAEAKRKLGIPIQDPAREEHVLDIAVEAVAHAAAAAGHQPPDEGDVRRLFRTQIEAARWIQARTLERPPPTLRAESSSEAARQHLEEELRPALIRIGNRIAWLIVFWRTRSEPLLDFSRVSNALANHALPDELMERITTELQAVRKDERAAASRRLQPTAAPDKKPNGSTQRTHPGSESPRQRVDERRADSTPPGS